ncbi:MAG TPA: Ig-like domain-containing protein [Solirubrobacterales bacterium]|nr:Ig-like domain-containing protein [Solirubrobacterales bacterium]
MSLLGVLVLASTASGASSGPPKYGELPDPLTYGKYTPKEVNQAVFGETTLEEPSSAGKPPGVAPSENANSSITLPVRGSMWLPEGYPGKSPLLLFVHGNHGECDSGKGPKCTIYKRNDEGYAYMAKNLASWGYTVVSLDQDELMARQDGLGKGMHARRLLIMAMLDKIKAADEGPLTTEGANVGSQLVGKIDMTRIGLMGHSRGGDAVASFVLYNQTLPVGQRFPLRAVVSIAPVDYERHAPYGVPYMTVFGSCDGDVSNLQGARLYERSQYESNDPYPRFQVIQVGGNHDAYNTVWQADGDDSSQADAACGPDAKGSKGQVPTAENGNVENVLGKLNVEDPHNIRLSGEAGPHFEAVEGETKPYRWGNAEKTNPLVNTRMSGDPALMGDQEKMGLATVAAFFRRYVGGEGAFEPYLTGELAAEGEPSIPQSACPTSEAGKRIPCIDRVADSYTAPPDERMDVLRPDTEHPTTLDALGTKIEASGFANPYPKSGGVQPRPATTPNGIDWCDPDPRQQEPGQLNEGEFPTAAKSCPQPAPHTLGGQGSNETPGAESTAAPREQAPVNGSYGRQLSLAWEEEADLGLKIPAKDGNVSDYRALYMATAVNFFDPRNPSRGEEGLWNPEYAPQNWTIAVTDAEGHEGTVEADDPDFGTATQQTLGSTSDRVHVILRDLRVPLAEFAEQGVNLASLRKLELRFGEPGMPSSGSIQLADVRFEQPATGFSNVLLDSTEPNAGPGEGEPTSGPNPVEEMEDGTYRRADGSYEIPNVTTVPGANVWTVDDDGVQCPNAEFEHIQEAVEYASPWDTIVVCPGVYYESSTPVNSELNPVLVEGEKDGLTINKPVKIIGAGANKVTIKPATSLTTLGGATGSLRDGGGNVVTVSRQSMGSTEYDEEYVDISGVKIESGSTAAEAGVAFFNASGRIANSEIGTIKAANGNGWGVVMTNSQIGTGPGSPERQVTIENSKIKGYATGGVLFDDSKGKADGSATTTERSDMNQVGYVKNTVVEGAAGNTTFAQTGIQVADGAVAHITGSTIAGNLDVNAGEERKSVGVLLTDAETLNGGFSITKSRIAGNGYGLFNADAKNETVREGAPAIATEDYWGTSGGSPAEGTATPFTKVEVVPVTKPPSYTYPTTVEGVSGADGASNPSVLFIPVLTALPAAPTIGVQPDVAPVGEIVNPDDGEAVEAGVAVEPVVFTEDDYGVRSVSLKANGVPVEAKVYAPYVFTWTPSAAEIGSSVRLEATITDSAGHVVTSDVTVPVVKSAAEAGAEAAEEAAAKEATEKAAEKKAAEDAVKAAEERADAATKAAEAKTDEAAKAAKEANERIAKLEKAEQITFGAVTKNTKRGTARLGVVVPVPGPLKLTGPGVRTVTGNPTGPGEVQLLVTAKGAALKALNKKGKVTVTVKVTLNGSSGTKTRTTTVTLVKK